ncbi:Uncharacterized protein Adt_17990 [Abeliophyllum distichum]|uniref:DUF1985 domain-containing protein n=1 Tax=Abeliophyllum distichum TaxID=126358 RepID=A0ABD1TIU8_9LAMI
MRSSCSISKSKRNTKKRRNLSSSKRNRGLNNGTAKPMKKKVNIPVPEGQTEWDYLISPDKWALGKVNAFSNTTIFSSLKGMMNDSQKKMFRDTCFAHFLDVKDIIVNHQLIHQVLLREVKQPNPDEMWFKIGDNIVSFTMEDFCLITGLGLEDEDKRSIFDSTYCRINNEYLSHLSSISTSDISQFFINSAYLCDEDVVRFGLLYLLTNLMFMTTYKKSVEESLMVLIDSLEFNSYAWGKELFKITLSSLKAGLRNKSLIIEGDGKLYLAYRICGFVLAFQMWIYETIPILDGKIYSRIGSRSPRMLNWTSRVNETFNHNLNVGKDIFGRPDISVFD